MSSERARRIVAVADAHDGAMGEIDDLAERLWRAGVQPEPGHTLSADGLKTWRRVAGEAARWAAEDDV